MPPYLKMMDDAKGKTILTRGEYEQAALMAMAVLRNADANALLQDCLVEHSIYFTHEKTGIQCKARPDAWAGALVIDLKTSASANHRDFQKSVFKYGYDIQAAIIKMGLASINTSLEKFVFLAVEKEPPYAIGIYVLDEEVIDYATNKLGNLLLKYSECLQENKWPCYPLQSILLPKWVDFGDDE